MAYLVLARKYRPTTFSEVIGQDHVTRTLGNAFTSERVHHAFLFCGPRGCGKTTLARIVGKAINCTKGPTATAEPCGICSACTSIANGSSTDYQEMDGASNRGIDAIRELTEAVRYQPAVLRKKVYVIDEVHMLTTEAFNALLKTLEEPPPHVTFVLATTEPHKLPNTILSRCQRYDFKLVPAARLAQHLTAVFEKEALAIEPTAVSLLVRESGGSVRDALSLSDQIISYVGTGTITEKHVAEVLGVADRSLTRSLVQALSQGDAGAALGAIESAIERGVDEVQLARAIVRYLRDLSVMQVAPDRPGLVDATEDELRELRAEAGALERSRVMQMFERMLRCCDELGKTLQPRLVLDCALIDVATTEPLVPLGDLIDRLGDLETRLAGKTGARAAYGSGGGGSDRAAMRMTTPGNPVGSSRAPSPSPSRASSAAPSAPSAPSAASAPSAPSASRAAPSGSSEVAGSPSSAPVAVAKPPIPAATERPARNTGSREAGTRGGAGPSEGAPVLPDDAAPQTGTPRAGDQSGPVFQPSGPVPKVESVASGSGPNDHDKRVGALAAPVVPAPPAPGGAAASGPMEIPTTQADSLRAWDGVLEELMRRRKVVLGGYCEHARVMSWTAEEIVLGYSPDFHHFGELVRDSAEDVRIVLREVVRGNPKLSVRMLDGAAANEGNGRSVLEATREKSTAERHKRELEAREHPITKHVLQTFGAQIKEIKTDV